MKKRIKIETISENNTGITVDIFQEKFGLKLATKMIYLWNENHEDFNIEEIGLYLNLIANIHSHTNILMKNDERRIDSLKDAMILGMENKYVTNFSIFLKNIISNFWKNENFEFLEKSILSKSFVDISKFLNTLKQKIDVLDSVTIKSFMYIIVVE